MTMILKHRGFQLCIAILLGAAHLGATQTRRDDVQDRRRQ
jgi:hypothetical protein